MRVIIFFSFLLMCNIAAATNIKHNQSNLYYPFEYNSALKKELNWDDVMSVEVDLTTKNKTSDPIKVFCDGYLLKVSAGQKIKCSNLSYIELSLSDFKNGSSGKVYFTF